MAEQTRTQESPTEYLSIRLYDSTKEKVPNISIRKGEPFYDATASTPYTSLASALDWLTSQLSQFDANKIGKVIIRSFHPLLTVASADDVEKLVLFKQQIDRLNYPKIEDLYPFDYFMRVLFRTRFGKDKNYIGIFHLLDNPSAFAYLLNITKSQADEAIAIAKSGRPEEFDKYINHHIAFIKTFSSKPLKNAVNHFSCLTTRDDDYSGINQCLTDFKKTGQVSQKQLQELTDTVNGAITFYKENPTAIVPLPSAKYKSLSLTVAKNVAENRQITYVDPDEFALKTTQGTLYNHVPSDNFILITDFYRPKFLNAFGEGLAKIRNSNPKARITVFCLTYDGFYVERKM